MSNESPGTVWDELSFHEGLLRVNHEGLAVELPLEILPSALDRANIALMVAYIGDMHDDEFRPARFQYVFSSESVAKIFGLPLKQLREKGHQPHEFIHPDDRSAFTNYVEQRNAATVGQRMPTHYFRIIDAQGDIKVLELKTQLHVFEGKVYSSVVAIEITELLHRREQAEVLQYMIRMVGHAAGNLQTTQDMAMYFINAAFLEINLDTKSLIEGVEVDEVENVANALRSLDDTNLVKTIAYGLRSIQATSKLQRLFARIARVATATKEGVRYEHKVKINLAALAKDLLAELDTQLRTMAIEVDIDSDLVWLGDKNLLELVILELLVNAEKYTRKTGREKRVSLSAKLSEDNKHMLFQVSDNGIGIKAEDLSKVFRMDWRSEEAIQTATGSGFGLASALFIACNLLSGSLEVDSQGLGQGAEFTIRLPIPGSEA